MSRTIRRKNQDLERFGSLFYTRAFGHETDWRRVEGEFGFYLGYVQASKEEVHRSKIYAYGDGKRYGTIGSRMNAWARKTEEHKHRRKERAKVVRFMQGKSDDVVITDLARFPKNYW